MTCHVCAKPTCVDDCASFPPPPLKVGSAEHKLQELLKIADEMSDRHLGCSEYGGFRCNFCDGIEVAMEIEHDNDCPILKLEQFKASLS